MSIPLRAGDRWQINTDTHFVLEWVDALTREPGILDAVERVLGPDLLAWNTSWFIKMPGDATYVSWHQDGAYWGIRVDQARYPVKSAIAVPFDRSLKLANEPTRLARMDPQVQERLINWGYAVCDAAMRSHVLEPAAFAKVKVSMP